MGLLGLFQKRNKVNYEVWGYDTFSHEYYLCAVFCNRRDAEILRDEKRREVFLSQCESLRDEYWIVEITDEEKIERNKREDLIRKEKNDELSFNSDHLEQCVRELLKLLKSSFQKIDPEKLSTLKNKSLKHEVKCDNEEDCFTSVRLETYFCANLSISLGVGVDVRSGKYFGGSVLRFGKYEGSIAEMIEWSDTEKALNDCKIEVMSIIWEIDE